MNGENEVNVHPVIWRRLWLIPIFMLMAFPGTVQAAEDLPPLQITQVSADPLRINPTKGERVSITYVLSLPAAVTVKLYGPDDRLVREIAQGVQPAGEHKAVWDGRDAGGRPVPAEAYVYTIEARAEAGHVVVHDLTDLTRGKDDFVKGVRYDPSSGRIAYSLVERSRVNVRVFLGENGPLLTTLVDWGAREPGEQAEVWDGWDRARGANLKDHPKIQASVLAFVLSRNVVRVLGTPVWDRARPAPGARRPPTPVLGARRHEHSRHERSSCYDPPIRIEWPADLPRASDGIPRVSGPVMLRVTAAPEDMRLFLDERLEAIWYVDGVFAGELEQGYLPFHVRWDPAGAAPGAHLLSVMVGSYAGHLGSVSVKVWVEERQKTGAKP